MNIEQKLNHFCSHQYPDPQIYQNLRAFMLSLISPEQLDRHVLEYKIRRAKIRSKTILSLISFQQTPSSLLDIGCGDGLLTAELRKKLGISKPNVHATDISDQRNGLSKNDLTFILSHGVSISLPDESKELCTLIMTLHHAEESTRLLRETHRVLRNGGILVIREHDASDPSTVVLAEIINNFFTNVFLYDSPVAGNSINRYRTKDSWYLLFRKIGFQIFGEDDSEKDTPYRPFMCLLKKSKSSYIAGI